MPSTAFARFWQVDLTRECFLGCLNQDDLRAMRLVSHDFANTVSPMLFKDVTVNFNATCFARQARIAALGRIGHLVKTFTFNMPHTDETFLPPLLDPDTLEEVLFTYEPQIQAGRPSSAGESASCRYGSWELNDLLIRQYPLLFHSATNVPSFIQAIQSMPHLRHLRISCPNKGQPRTNRRDIVDYALISLRIAVEQSNPTCLETLSLDPIHSSATYYLRPQNTIGASPSSTRVWRRIKTLNVVMENPETDYTNIDCPTDYLKTLHNYLSVFTSLRHFKFTWTGTKGPSPFSLNTEPCTSRPSSLDYSTCLPPLSSSPPSLASSPVSASSSTSSLSFSSRRSINSLRALRFRHLRYIYLCNAVLDATQASTFIHAHRKTLSEFQFESCHLRTGTWDDALEPLTKISGSDDWRRHQYAPVKPSKPVQTHRKTHPALRPTRPSIQIPPRSSSSKFFNEINPETFVYNEIMDVPLILSPEEEIPEIEFVHDRMWQPDSIGVFDDLDDRYSLAGSWGRRKKSANALRRLGEKMGLVGVKVAEEHDGDPAMEGVRRLLTGRSVKLGW